MRQAGLQQVNWAENNEVIGKEKLSEYTANIAFAGLTTPRIFWMKEMIEIYGITEEFLPLYLKGDVAILAAVGCGEFCGVKIVDTLEATPELVEKYEKRYQVFHLKIPYLKLQKISGRLTCRHARVRVHEQFRIWYFFDFSQIVFYFTVDLSFNCSN